MQRILLSLKKLQTNSTPSPLFSHPCMTKPFTSLTTKPHQAHNFGSSLASPVHHFHPLGNCRRVHGFLSNPVASRHLLSNLSGTLLRASSRSIKDWNFLLFRARNGGGFSGFNRLVPSLGRGWRSPFQRLTAENVVYGLIIANFAVFSLWRVADKRFMVNNFMISLDNFKAGRLHTLITSAFSQLEFGHIFTNMLGLYFFGMNIGRSFGPEFLLKLYLAGALGGSVLYLIHHAWMASNSSGRGTWGVDPSRTPGLGASGAVNAIMLLDIFLNPRATIYFEFLIPVPAMFLGIFMIGHDFWRIMQGDSFVSGSAHLGGAAVAALAWYRIRKGRF